MKGHEKMIKEITADLKKNEKDLEEPTSAKRNLSQKITRLRKDYQADDSISLKQIRYKI